MVLSLLGSAAVTAALRRDARAGPPGEGGMMEDGWQVQQSSAEAYERYLVPAMMTHWADRLVDAADPKAGERVLDVGCGTGIVARRAAPRVGARGRVVGLDLNDGMLVVARSASSSIEPPIEWRQGNATSLPFPEKAFDVVFSQQMLQFVPDPSAALREMRRVLAPHGRLAVSVCRPIEHSPGYPQLVEALKRHVGPEAAATMGSPFPPWTIDDLRRFAATAGIGDSQIRFDVLPVRYPSAEEFLRRETASAPLAGSMRALNPGTRAVLVQDLETSLRSRRDDEGVMLPIETYLLRVDA